MSRVALAVVLVLVLAGCGGTSARDQPATPPARVPDDPVAAIAARFPSPPAIDPSRVAAAVRQRAASAGLDLDALELVPGSPPTIRVVLRLRESQLFDPAAHRWFSTLVPEQQACSPACPFAVSITVLAPDGARVAYEEDSGNGSGATAGPDSVSDAPVPDALATAPTRLRIRLENGADAAPILLRCDGTATGLPGAEAVCERILRRRWTLFPPRDGGCFGSVIGPGLAVDGVLGGHDVSIRTNDCPPTLASWRDALGPLGAWDEWLRLTAPAP